MINNLPKIIFLSLFFTVVIFFINYNFFGNKNFENNIAEEIYIEPEIKKNIKTNNDLLDKKQKKEIINYYEKQKKYSFKYIPSNYKNEINNFEDKLKKILNKNIFRNKISKLQIKLIKEKIDRRGKMKDKSIKLFGMNINNQTEYLAVFIHEFAHYLDIYFLEKKVFFDISNKFYEISWNKTLIKKKNQNQNDFVSGYALTNKYEDFAETFTYYILHNKDFLEKTKNSKILKDKYDFFSIYIFKNKEFFATKFDNNQKIKNYYRDITKINFEQNKLFNYLEKLD